MLKLQSLWALWTAVGVIGVMGSQIRVLRQLDKRHSADRGDLAAATTLSAQIKKWRCHFTQVARGSLPYRRALVFVRQHDGDDGFTVITWAENQFQGEPLTLCCTPVSRNTIQIK